MSELPELVDLSVIFPSLHIDLKYATADNITGAPIYREARCLLHTEAVTALAKSISIAQLAGLQLVVYDAYRPSRRRRYCGMPVPTRSMLSMSRLVPITVGVRPLTSR